MVADITQRKLAEEAVAGVGRRLSRHRSRNVPGSPESFTTTSVNVSHCWQSR
jgi:hypothetical protein